MIDRRNHLIVVVDVVVVGDRCRADVAGVGGPRTLKEAADDELAYAVEPRDQHSFASVDQFCVNPHCGEKC